MQILLKRRGQMKTLSLILTDKCNLRCSFCLCLDSLNKGESLSLEDIYKFIDWQLELYPNEEFKIEFFGSEPMLEYDKILAVYNRYKELSNISFSIFTNGVFTKKVDIEVVSSMFDEIILSLEGPRDLSLDRHPSDVTYNKALNNLKKLLKLNPYNIGIGTVLLPDTDIDRVFNFFKNLGVRYYNFEIVTHINNDKSSGIDNKNIFRFLSYIFENIVVPASEGDIDKVNLYTIPRELISSNNYFRIFNKDTHSCFKNFRALAPDGSIHFCRDNAINNNKLKELSTNKDTFFRSNTKVPFNVKDIILDRTTDTFKEDLKKYENYIACPVKSFESYHLIGYSMPWIKDKDFQDLIIAPMFLFSYDLFNMFHKYTSKNIEIPEKDFSIFKSNVNNYKKVMDYYGRLCE